MDLLDDWTTKEIVGAILIAWPLAIMAGLLVYLIIMITVMEPPAATAFLATISMVTGFYLIDEG